LYIVLVLSAGQRFLGKENKSSRWEAVRGDVAPFHVSIIIFFLTHVHIDVGPKQIRIPVIEYYFFNDLNCRDTSTYRNSDICIILCGWINIIDKFVNFKFRIQRWNYNIMLVLRFSALGLNCIVL